MLTSRLNAIARTNSPQKGAGSRGEVTSAPRPVAVVDRDLSVRRALVRLIRSFGLAVESFASGGEYLEADHPDGVACLIVDLELEDMSGVDLYDRIASRGGAPPLILIDARDAALAEERARRSGAVAFFRKPFDAAALMTAVGKATASAAPVGGDARDPGPLFAVGRNPEGCGG